MCGLCGKTGAKEVSTKAGGDYSGCPAVDKLLGILSAGMGDWVPCASGGRQGAKAEALATSAIGVVGWEVKGYSHGPVGKRIGEAGRYVEPWISWAIRSRLTWNWGSLARRALTVRLAWRTVV